MTKAPCRIGVVAPACPLSPEVPARIGELAAALFPGRTPEIAFHPQCFASHGHFAGDDATRAGAFVEIANDPRYDAVWFGRGGYGSCRIAETVLARLQRPARSKTYLGYSDCGALLGALYRHRIGRVAHGPVAQDIMREGGDAAAARALAWLIEGAPGALEPTVGQVGKTAAFNITVLSQILGTRLEPDLAGHVLMLEDVSEYMYRIDRSFFHITGNPGIQKVEGIMLGRVSAIPPNDLDFGMTEEEVARHWCGRSGIPYLGRADIGHDVANKIVPFGVPA